jgi:hypothetical protein
MEKADNKTKPLAWTFGLDESDIREAFDEATVDCHDTYEQHTGLLTAIQDELTLFVPSQSDWRHSDYHRHGMA